MKVTIDRIGRDSIFRATSPDDERIDVVAIGIFEAYMSAWRMKHHMEDAPDSPPMRCAECDCENGGADCNWISALHIEDARYPYSHNGPTVYESKLDDLLISEAMLKENGLLPDAD